jgi:DNA-binding NarL/FixJ family response regulator
LDPWARANGLRLEAHATSDIFADIDTDSLCCIVILSIGADSLKARETVRILKVIRALWADVPLVIVADTEDPSEVSAALCSGADGFIFSGTEPQLALEAFTFILKGGSYFPPSAIRSLASAIGPASDATPGGSPKNSVQGGSGDGSQVLEVDENGKREYPLDNCGPLLTPREADVTMQLRTGRTNKQIARELGMTEATVKVHMRKIIHKLGVHNRVQVAVSSLPS